MSMANTRKAHLDDLAHDRSLPYRLEVVKSEHGNYVISYPELPGCVTQIDDLADLGPIAEEILAGWLELAIEDGQQIPEPEPTSEYSGKFLVRLPKSLHQALAEAARDEGVSLNAYITAILADGPAWRARAGMAQLATRV
jgi:antitoxin HicB